MNIIENIAKWICTTLTKDQAVSIIEVLKNLVKDPTTKFKAEKPDYPNYRKFRNDPETPIKAEQSESPALNYKEILKKKR